MAFTSIYKTFSQFGHVVMTYPTGTPHTDFSYPIYHGYSSYNAYYNKNMPFSYIAISQNLASPNYWHAFSSDYSDNIDMPASDYVGQPTNITAYLINGKMVLRCVYTNTTSSAKSIKSIVNGISGNFYRNDSDGQTASIRVAAIYYNLDTAITIPANDSIFLDITLEPSGDVRSVNVVENR